MKIRKGQIDTDGWVASVSEFGLVKASAGYDANYTQPVAVNPNDGKMYTLQGGGGGGGAAQMQVSDDNAGNVTMYVVNVSNTLAATYTSSTSDLAITLV